jgi:hypothetical protein
VSCCLVLLFLIGDIRVGEAASIGRAEKVVLDVRSVMPKGERRLVVNADVFKDDIVETKARSATRLVFRDETYLSMGPKSRVRIADLPVAQDDDSPFVVEATEGVFKFVSGRMRSERYRIETPAGTIGVRGTIVWLYVDAAGNAEVASQVGEVRPCGAGTCRHLVRGEYSQMRKGQVPTPPAPVPDAFYDRIRDMVARLMLDGTGARNAPLPPNYLFAADGDGEANTSAPPSNSLQTARAGIRGPGSTFVDTPQPGEPDRLPQRDEPPQPGDEDRGRVQSDRSQPPPPDPRPPDAAEPVLVPGPPTGLLLLSGLATWLGLARLASRARRRGARRQPDDRAWP